MLKAKYYTSILTALSIVSFTTPVISSVVQADSVNQYQQQKNNQEQDQFKGLTDSEFKQIGMSDKDIQRYHKNINSDLYLENGYITNPDQNPLQRGKFTWAVKIIRKSYGRIPRYIRAYIDQRIGIGTLLSFIENATGALQNAIYNACRKAGMNPTWANVTTSAIMALI